MATVTKGMSTILMVNWPNIITTFIQSTKMPNTFCSPSDFSTPHPAPVGAPANAPDPYRGYGSGPPGSYPPPGQAQTAPRPYPQQQQPQAPPPPAGPTPAPPAAPSGAPAAVTPPAGHGQYPPPPQPQQFDYRQQEQV